jgi:hypothetical protein
MIAEDLRSKLRSEIASVDATALLPHHRRGALLMLSPDQDLLEVAVAIASDDARAVSALVEKQALSRPTLGQLADWCVAADQRFQFVILQPYVLAQAL